MHPLPQARVADSQVADSVTDASATASPAQPPSPVVGIPDNQALERSQPTLPMRSGIRERQAHDYARHGVTCLFAALNTATGQVTDACYPRHRHQKFPRFLKKAAACPCTELQSSAATTPPTSTPMSGPGWPRTLQSHHALHADRMLVDQSRGVLLRDHPPRSATTRPGQHQGIARSSD